MGGDDDPMKSKFTVSLPDFPGEDFYAHAAAVWLEKAKVRMTDAGLLTVCEGNDPEVVKSIIDLELLPSLPADHPHHFRREDERNKALTQIKSNKFKRFTIVMRAWTAIFTALKACTEDSAPVLSRELMMQCDLALRGIPGGYFDGPRAWRTILDKIGRKRSKEDKNYYRMAENIQVAKQLADGCLASDYAKKALAFYVHIRPYLAQRPDDDDTTSISSI